MRLLYFLNEIKDEQSTDEELDLEKVRPDFIKKLNYGRQNELIIDAIITEFQWLLDCDFKNAYFTLTKSTLPGDARFNLIVKYCEWLNGSFEEGTWSNGIWHNGIWKSGQWKLGEFKKGTWEMGKWSSGNFNGTWINGVWYGGSFKGKWKNGKWYGGEFNGSWLDGEWYGGEWKGKKWNNGLIYSSKFDAMIQSSKNPNDFHDIETKSKKIKELERKTK